MLTEQISSNPQIALALSISPAAENLSSNDMPATSQPADPNAALSTTDPQHTESEEFSENCSNSRQGLPVSSCLPAACTYDSEIESVCLHRFFLGSDSQLLAVENRKVHRSNGPKLREALQSQNNLALTEFEDFATFRVPKSVYLKAQKMSEPQHFLQRCLEYAFSLVEISTSTVHGDSATRSTKYPALPEDRLTPLFNRTQQLYSNKFCASTAFIKSVATRRAAVLGESTSRALSAVNKKCRDYRLLTDNPAIAKQFYFAFGIELRPTVRLVTVSTAQLGLTEVVSVLPSVVLGTN